MKRNGGQTLRYGKKMLNETLKRAIDREDYRVVELLIAIGRENIYHACAVCEAYLNAKSGKGRREVVDRIPEHIAKLQARAVNGGVDPEQN